MRRFSMLLLIWAACQAPADVLAPSRAQAPSPPGEQEQLTKEIGTLVRQLGSDSFREREGAQRKLLKIGAAVRIQLQQASKSDDKEIARRAAALLDEIRRLDQAPPLGTAPEQPPTEEKFYLKIEPLIDNVDDLDVRRFTVITKGQRLVKFYVSAGCEAKSVRHPAQGGDTHLFEAIVVLRLHGGGNRTLNRYLKFDRTAGSSAETNVPAPGVKSLRNLVQIKAASGLYTMGKGHVLGQIHGADMVVTVE